MKKIIKSICFSLLAFMFAIGSIFLPIGSKNTNQYASADTSTQSYLFQSSNIIFTRIANTNAYSSSGDFPTNYSTDFADYLYNSSTTNTESFRTFLNFNFKIERSNSVSGSYFYLYPYIQGYSALNRGLVDLQGISPRNDYVDLSDGGIVGYASESYDYSTPSLFSATRENTSYSNYVKVIYDLPYFRYDSNYNYRTLLGFVFVAPTYENNPTLAPTNLDINTIEISNFNDFCTNSFDLTPYIQGNNMNVVCYTDSIGYKFIYLIPSWVNYLTTEADYFAYRKYYTPNALDLSNNEIYLEGYNAGESTGYNNGYNNGYSSGQRSGYSNGYEDGMIDGALESENFTFVGLFSAVLDTPVKILTNLFNFDFLGINLWAFFTSILTIGLIVFVVKIFLRR